ncbi:hypothetical protein RI367_001061 [Sorochytrium milnesiophthora]
MSAKRQAICLSAADAAVVRVSLALQHMHVDPATVVDCYCDAVSDTSSTADIVCHYCDENAAAVATTTTQIPARRSSLQHLHLAMASAH